ncbi:hypothetical protein NLN92_18925 [Citrobacter portucalensis]|uniref:hypothetical protein n=1 Tax=Citrobacter portucalensis TaxID=1639133 RepID=UPI00226B9CDD|nr:hypothetical protein [Citrobacter portucalensis]MCX8980080.1 hypothetical protein [Citrobacter portucalensis]
MLTEQAMRDQHVVADAYLAECTKCGTIFPSTKLVEGQSAEGDAEYGVCHCPSCSASDKYIIECENPAKAWNEQQERIETLLNTQEGKVFKIAAPVPLPNKRICPPEHEGSLLWSEINTWNAAIDAAAEALRRAGVKVEVRYGN